MSGLVTESVIEVKPLRGIGGWLALPFIGLVVDLIILPFVALGGMVLLSSTIPEDAVVGAFTAMFSVALFAWTVYVFRLGVKGRRAFPKAFMTRTWVVSVGSLLTLNPVPFIGALIWNEYFKKSVRVANTFTE